MAKRLPPVDVVTIGVGLTGSLAALELAETGLKVVGLERSAPRDTVPDFQSPAIHDELRFAVRKALMQNNAKVAVTFRNTTEETALPIRRWESFLPGQGLGGSFVHWNGQSFRTRLPTSSTAPTTWNATARSSSTRAGPDLTIQDWGVDLVRSSSLHYDRFEYLLGVSGKAGNVQGRIQPGGNPFEAARSAANTRTHRSRRRIFGTICSKGGRGNSATTRTRPPRRISAGLIPIRWG